MMKHYVGGEKQYEGVPAEMNNIELIEKYSHYTAMSFRRKEEQSYLAVLRAEVLKRMDQNEEKRPAQE